jgi:hypothetical protein
MIPRLLIQNWHQTLHIGRKSLAFQVKRFTKQFGATALTLTGFGLRSTLKSS